MEIQFTEEQSEQLKPLFEKIIKGYETEGKPIGAIVAQIREGGFSGRGYMKVKILSTKAIREIAVAMKDSKG